MRTGTPSRSRMTTSARSLRFRSPARDAQQPLRAVVFDEAGTAIVVVVPQVGQQVLVGYAERQQSGRIRRHENLFLEAADGIDLDDARNAQQLRADDPVVHGPQVGRRDRCPVGVARPRLGVHDEHEDLAESGRDGAKRRFEPDRQCRSRGRQTLAYQLPGKVDVGTLLEHDGDLGQPVA